MSKAPLIYYVEDDEHIRDLMPEGTPSPRSTPRAESSRESPFSST